MGKTKVYKYVSTCKNILIQKTKSKLPHLCGRQLQSNCFLFSVPKTPNKLPALAGSKIQGVFDKMGKDRKHMRKLRKKRVKSTQKQIDKHEQKIEQESGRKDTTKDYWKKEIDEKFSKQMEEDEEYLKED